MNRFYAALEWLWHPDNLTAISTFVIAAFTIVLGWVGYCQARLIRKTIDLAREEFNATHRPKLIVRGAYLASKGDADTKARVDYEVVNIGEGPATVIDLRAFAYIQLTDTAFNPLGNAPLPEPPRKRFTLTSGQHVEVCTDCPSVDWQYDDFIHSGGQAFVIGTITYVGPDNIERITGFCRRYSKETGVWHRERDSDYEYAY